MQTLNLLTFDRRQDFVLENTLLATLFDHLAIA